MSVLKFLTRSPCVKLFFLALVITCLLELIRQTNDLKKLLESHRHVRRTNANVNNKQVGGTTHEKIGKHRKTVTRREAGTQQGDNQEPERENVLLLKLSGSKGQNQSLAGIRHPFLRPSILSYKPASTYDLPLSLQPVISKLMSNNFQNLHRSNFSNGSFSFSHPSPHRKFNSTLMEDVFRSGFGLEPYVTEKGERGWIENGVIYRPIEHDKKLNQSGKGSHHSEFEAYIPFNEDFFFEGRTRIGSRSITEKEKKIILWQVKARYVPPMPNVQPLRKCPDMPCYVTTNLKYTKVSAAIVFSGQLIRGNPPKRTSSNQMFVFHNQEPPIPKWFHKPAFKTRPWKNAFNWTMSYRMDSDIVSHYGILRKRPKSVDKNYTAIVSKKSGLVAWMVSHCDTSGKREKYVAELRKYVQVDIYGRCGQFKCNRTMDDQCAEMIATKYKFYLSFENAICPDYITEKFFRYMSLDMITVARGGNQFSQHAPSEIFLNTADFASPKDLARAILYLDKHEDLYIKMLKEKDKYMQLYEDYPIRDKEGVVQYIHYHHEAVAFCEMCQKLWNLDKNRNSVPDIAEWFDRKHCYKPVDLTF